MELENEKPIKEVRQSPKGAVEKSTLQVSMGQRWIGCCIPRNFLFLERKSTLLCSGPFSSGYTFLIHEKNNLMDAEVLEIFYFLCTLKNVIRGRILASSTVAAC